MSIFNKIINREIPANIVYENKYVIAFKDIKLLTITFNINNNGNKIYTIRESGLGWIFDDPRPIFIGSIGDIYFGFYNQDNHDFQANGNTLLLHFLYEYVEYTHYHQ